MQNPIIFFKTIVKTYLDPAERVAELLFGLVMVLTFTLGAGMVVTGGREGVRELLIATLGCNIAWGIIDGIIYMMLRTSERARKMQLALKLRSIRGDKEAAQVLKDEMGIEFSNMLSGESMDKMSQDILSYVRAAEPKKVRIEKNDLMGALASFYLVFITTVPAVIPFIFFDSPRFALRISNLLLISLLFWTGWRWADYTRTNRFAGGFSMMAIGIVLVIVAILLGG